MKLRAVVTAVGAVAAALVVMSPAQAATAQARGYDHKDPYQTGCGNSARAVRTANINSQLEGKIGTIKLMYSFSCKTNWIEINTITAGYGSITVQNARAPSTPSSSRRATAAATGATWSTATTSAPGAAPA